MAVAAQARPRGSSRGGLRSIGTGWVIATYALLIFFTLWTVVPFFWMFLASVKTNKEIYQDFTFLPRQWYWGHYYDLITGHYGSWMRNSTTVSVAATLLSIILGSFGAYAITRLQFTGRSVIARGLVFTYLLPASLLFIPLFQIVAGVGLSNSVFSLMLIYPSFTLPFCTWMLMSYFKNIPIELEEAALIDGCGRLGVLFRIVLPLAAPALVVVCLFSFTNAWNEFLYALVFISSREQQTVTVGLALMQGEDVFYWGKMMAGALLTALPPVIMYTLAQRLVIQGLTMGGVKG
ncbi:MAG TPA: carbohydrate ABC transporter permease [Chloroflexota bacterium]|nr:carbohydrate ABC transporter permease [Chloroflexota bacterium]